MHRAPSFSPSLWRKGGRPQTSNVEFFFFAIPDSSAHSRWTGYDHGVAPVLRLRLALDSVIDAGSDSAESARRRWLTPGPPVAPAQQGAGQRGRDAIAEATPPTRHVQQ